MGGGASRLADRLVELGFACVSVLDISAGALAAASERLGSASPVELLRGDVLTWRPSRGFDLWHDRAVFHFLVERDDRRAYLETVRAALRPGAGLVIATFAPDGPASCSGLPVSRYSTDQLLHELGDEFAPVESNREEHATPGGAIQPFTWIACRFRGAPH